MLPLKCTVDGRTAAHVAHSQPSSATDDGLRSASHHAERRPRAKHLKRSSCESEAATCTGKVEPRSYAGVFGRSRGSWSGWFLIRLRGYPPPFLCTSAPTVTPREVLSDSVRCTFLQVVFAKTLFFCQALLCCKVAVEDCCACCAAATDASSAESFLPLSAACGALRRSVLLLCACAALWSFSPHAKFL